MKRGKKGLIQVLWGLLAFAGISAAHATAPTLNREAGESRNFWVKTLNGYRLAETTLRAVGKRSYIYVEKSLWKKGVSPEFVEKLFVELEEKAPGGAVLPGMGVIELLENLFSPLPRVVSPDSRVSVVFTDIANNPFVEGYFNSYDQLPADKAEAEGERSNEANVVYINGLVRRSEPYTASVVAQELQNLINHRLKENEDLWFRETLGKAAKLASGYYVEHAALRPFAEQPHIFPLVSHSYVQQGPQLLFASFLLDSMPDKAHGLRLLGSHFGNGRQAVEALFREISSSPLTFDVIFSRFLSYVFSAAGRDLTGPRKFDALGLPIPRIRPYVNLKSFPADVRGYLMPYSVLVIELPEALPATAQVQITMIRQHGAEDSCSRRGSVLWKPIDLKTIAIYSVGCEHEGPGDMLQFHLRVLDRPSLISSVPFKIAL